MITINPGGTDCMNDVFCRKGKSRGANGRAGRNVADLLPLCEEELLSRGVLNCAVRTAADDRAWISSVDDRVRFYLRYIVSDYLEWHQWLPLHKLDFYVENVSEVNRVIFRQHIPNESPLQFRPSWQHC